MKKIVAYVLGLLLLAAPLLGALAQEASAASSRVAVIKELKGTVKVKKSGGSKEFTAFAKMSLNEGDIVTVGSDGSAVLQFANGSSEDDRMTVSANTTLTFSKLKEGKNTVTKVSVQSGSVWSTVKSIKSASDEYTLETPTAIMGVRGTNLLVYVDPVTGDSKFVIFSGVGQIAPTNTRTISQPPDVVVLPNHQVTIDDRNQTNQFPGEVIPIDLSSFLNGVSPQVIESIIGAKNAIDQENQQFIEKKKQELEAGQPGTPTGSSADLDRIIQNLNNLITNMLQEALKGNKITPSELQKLVDEANPTLNKKIDLANTPPQVVTDAEKLKMEQLKKQQEARQEAAKKQKEEELKSQRESLIKKIEEERAKQEEANKKALEDAKKKAKEEYEKKLSEAEKKRFEEESKKREEELKKQTAPRVTPTPTTGGGGGGSNPGSSPSSSPSQSPSPSPSESPDPTLPNGITGWTLMTASDQPLQIQRTKQLEQEQQHETIYAVKTESLVSSLKLKLEFGSDVSKVTLVRSGNSNEGQTIEWNASGEVKTLEGLETGYENFVINVTKEQSDSYSIEPLNNLFVLNGVTEPLWLTHPQPFGMEGTTYSRDLENPNLFRAEVSSSTANITLFSNQSDFKIEKVKVNGVELLSNYPFFDIELDAGANEIEISLADQAYYYKHIYTLIVTRDAPHEENLPEGLVSWSIDSDEQTRNIVTSGEDFAYAVLPLTEMAELDVELATGYKGELTLLDEFSSEANSLQAGTNQVPLHFYGSNYYKYSLLISKVDGSEAVQSTLVIRVGNALPQNNELNASGIDFILDDNPPMGMAYAGGQDFVIILPANTTEGRIDLDYFIREFTPSLTAEDTRIEWNNSTIDPIFDGEVYYYYDINGLLPGLNQMMLKVDPLRQFGPNVLQYNLDIYVGSIPQSLQIVSLTATDSASNTIFFQPSDLLGYTGQFQSGVQNITSVTFLIGLNPDTTLDREWLLNSQNGVSSVELSTELPLTYEVKMNYYGGQQPPYQSLELPLVLIENGNRMRYDIRINPANQGV